MSSITDSKSIPYSLSVTCIFLFFAFVSFVYPATAFAKDSQDEIIDLLEKRWYEVEILVFERLPVLDLNSSESLVSQRPRVWPHVMRELQTENQVLFRPINQSINSSVTSRQNVDKFYPQQDLSMQQRCFGWPMLATQDPVHPLLSAAKHPEISHEEANLSAETTTQEADSAPQPSDIPDARQVFMDTLGEFESTLAATSYVWMPTLTLNSTAKVINRRNHLRPIIHRRWRQAVPPRSSPESIYIHADDSPRSPMTIQGMHKIEGHLAVTVGRYLHVSGTLWYHADGLGERPQAIVENAHLLPRAPAISKQISYMYLSDSRRMRSRELHHIDHPKFGILVQIDPIEIPADLIETWELGSL
ncbi:MAG: hypothetical protein GXP16_11605 [Gammaproteobacteria bacterium]|nr:hypothetical protein [Gammaproteobacteria bacterium]